jgi:hypothetical protein
MDDGSTNFSLIPLMGLFPDPPHFAPKVVFVHLMHVAHLCIICTLFRLEVNRLYSLYLLWPTLYPLFVVVCFGARIFLFFIIFKVSNIDRTYFLKLFSM